MFISPFYLFFIFVMYEMSPTKKSPKVAKTFYCELCDYICGKQSDYDKHLLRRKHKILQNPTIFVAENNTF